MEEDHTWSAWSPHSYENIHNIQECYESAVMSSHMVDQTRFIPVLVHKKILRMSGSRRRALTTQRGMRSKRHHSGSDYFVECCARAIPLRFPRCPLPVGPIHLTIGLFRGVKCLHPIE